MSYCNPHSDYIDKRIRDLKRSKKWKTQIVNTSHDDIVKDFGANVFTNLIRNTFTATYLKKHPCSDCKNPSKERCHGIGEERPILLLAALKRVYPDITKPISMLDIIVAFLEEHKTTKFTFKCSECHKKESSQPVYHTCSQTESPTQ
jgi:hypothetical protein